MSARRRAGSVRTPVRIRMGHLYTKISKETVLGLTFDRPYSMLFAQKGTNQMLRLFALRPVTYVIPISLMVYQYFRVFCHHPLPRFSPVSSQLRLLRKLQATSHHSLQHSPIAQCHLFLGVQHLCHRLNRLDTRLCYQVLKHLWFLR